MKKAIAIFAIMFAAFTANAQKVTTDAAGNYVAVKTAAKAAEPAKPTRKTYTDTKGNVYPVMVSAKGKLFVIRTSKAGKEYKQYLKVN
jgi:hypothetical protein